MTIPFGGAYVLTTAWFLLVFFGIAAIVLIKKMGRP